MRLFKVFALLLVALTVSINLQAQPTIAVQPVITSGLGSPVYITNAKDDTNRLFVVEQAGVIKVLLPGATTALTTPFLDIQTRIIAGGELGLLGLAFHPQFAANRKFYVNYTRLADNATVIAEFAVTGSNPNVADPASERILLTIPQPFSNHKGGMIEFGKDGFLHIGMGDGGSANDPGNRSQNRTLLLGKMLRIDVTPSGGNQYTIPADNPFTGANTALCPNGSTTSGNTCREIWSIGLRNPFRWSFDRGGTNQLYAADVGQNSLEEIDIVTSGGNFGWRVYEGTNCTNLDASLCIPANYIAPIYEYFNSGSNRCSITGGYVYRGRRNSLPLGTYLFSDYCTGELMIQGAPRNPTVLLDTPRNVASFGEDENGEIYVVGLGGTIERVVNPNAVTPRNVKGDFDGDLRTDIAVYRPSAGSWIITDSFNSATRYVQFGNSQLPTRHKPAPGDFDNDGKADVGIYSDNDNNSNNNVYYSLDSSTGTFRSTRYGVPGDVPVIGDYDGDRRSDLAVFRPSNGTWYVRRTDGSLSVVQWGQNGDIPMSADYDGDGKNDFAVFRPSNNVWYVLQSSNGAIVFYNWGASGDIPVDGDFDGDGKFDVAVWRPSNGTWYVIQSSGGNLFRQWGQNGDTPVPGFYDGDAKTDFAVTRNAGGSKTWFITRSFNPAVTRSFQFGITEDVSVPATDVP